jgi:hypothetical protein
LNNGESESSGGGAVCPSVVAVNTEQQLRAAEPVITERRERRRGRLEGGTAEVGMMEITGEENVSAFLGLRACGNTERVYVTFSLLSWAFLLGS